MYLYICLCTYIAATVSVDPLAAPGAPGPGAKAFGILLPRWPSDIAKPGTRASTHWGLNN